LASVVDADADLEITLSASAAEWTFSTFFLKDLLVGLLLAAGWGSTAFVSAVET
jgi:hypothetical protein